MNIKQLTAAAAVCALAASGSAALAAGGNNDSGSGDGAKSAKCAKPGKPRGGPFKDIAAALGIKESELHKQLKSGKKLSEIATAQGKTLDDVKAAVKASLKTKLDKAVAAGKLTQTQADERLSHVDSMLDDIEAGKKPPKGPRGHGGPGAPGGPPPGM